MKISRVRVNLVLVLFAVIHAASSAAGVHALQETFRIPDEPSCGACSIERSYLTRLGRDRPPGIVQSDFARVVRDNRGRFFLYDRDPAIHVFDPNGTYETSQGRQGQGPGEYQQIEKIGFDAAGNVLVYDSRQYRLTTLTPDLEVLDTAPLAVRPTRAVVLPSGETYLASRETGPATVGFPLHKLGADGTRLLSFGEEPRGRTYPSNAATRFYQRINARAGDDGLWSTFMQNYVLERWSPNGEKEVRIERNAPWFPPRAGNEPFENGHPNLIGLQEDSEGRLWVLIAMPADDWRQRLAADNKRTLGLNGDYRDTVIEVIEPEGPEGPALLARTSVPELLFFIDEHMVGAVINVDLDSYVNVWTLELSERSQKSEGT